MNTCTESIFASIARKLNDRGITLRRNGEVKHSDGTVTYDTDAALIYHDGGEKYVVVKTVHGYEVWNGNSRVVWGVDVRVGHTIGSGRISRVVWGVGEYAVDVLVGEYAVDVLVDDIYRAVVGTSIYTLADWQQEVAAGNTERGYRDWVEAKIGEAEFDRLVATK